MQPNHLDLIAWEVTIAERQARIKSDIQALRAQAGPSRPGALRRRVGQTLIAIGYYLTEPASETRPLPVQPALSGATQR